MNIYINAYVDRKKEEFKENTYQSYLISRFVWQKEVNIDKILNGEKKKEQMTDDAMLNQVKVLNKLFGGEVNVNGNEE